jgi:hypothetical protein
MTQYQLRRIHVNVLMIGSPSALKSNLHFQQILLITNFDQPQCFCFASSFWELKDAKHRLLN